MRPLSLEDGVIQYEEPWAELEAGRLKTWTLVLGHLPFLSPQFPHLTNKGLEKAISSAFAILRSFMVP